jgi:uncharacterized protein (UPF0218 family)
VSRTRLEVPESLRPDLKEPLGPVFADAEQLLEAASQPMVAVGDMVTYHLLAAGTVPTVAVVDGRTERTAVDQSVRDRITGFDTQIEVENAAATITADLLDALNTALENAGTTLIVVDGEEDLATLPAVLAAPDGASVVYGQPGEGMVLVTVDADTRAQVRPLLERMDGDSDAVLARLD